MWIPKWVRTLPPQAEEEEPQVAWAGKYENCGYMCDSIGGVVYYALYDPGATCSVAGPALGERFADRLQPSSSGMHVVNGRGSNVLGTLPVMLEMERVSKGIKLRVVNAVDQPMILEVDFGRAFKISTEWELERWRSIGGRWYKFVTESGKRFESPIAGECAGLSTINDDQRSEVDKLVDEVLANQKDQPGYTRFIEHRIRVTDDRPFKHKIIRISEAVLGEARRTVDK